MEKIAAGVAGIESQAEKMLEKARTQAQEILLKTKEECKAIALQDLPLEETRATCENVILVQAREEAGRINEESEKVIAETKNNVKKKMNDITGLIVSLVTGDQI